MTEKKQSVEATVNDIRQKGELVSKYDVALLEKNNKMKNMHKETRNN